MVPDDARRRRISKIRRIQIATVVIKHLRIDEHVRRGCSIGHITSFAKVPNLLRFSYTSDLGRLLAVATPNVTGACLGTARRIIGLLPTIILPILGLWHSRHGLGTGRVGRIDRRRPLAELSHRERGIGLHAERCKGKLACRSTAGRGRT